jgi:hypothetical protein
MAKGTDNGSKVYDPSPTVGCDAKARAIMR